MSKYNTEISSVQMMRGFAAILIALFHFSEMLASNGGKSPVAFLLNGGYGGVDVFFVISGFIMALSSQRLRAGIFPAFLFFLKRILRIFGGWVPVFLILSVAFFFLSPYRWSNANLVKSLFLLPQPHSENILAVTWALSYEIYFYTMLSLLIITFNHHVIYAILSYALLILIMRSLVEVFEITPMFADYIIYAGDHRYPNIMLSAYTLEFLTGFVAYYMPRRLSISLASWLVGLGVLIFVSGMTYINFVLDGGYLGGCLLRAVFFGFSSVLIVAGLVKLEMAKKIRIPRFFIFLGNTSYSIYLLHIPIYLAYFTIIFKIRAWTGFPFLWYSGVTTVGTMIALLILSNLYYSFVENPIHKRIRTLMGKAEKGGSSN